MSPDEVKEEAARGGLTESVSVSVPRIRSWSDIVAIFTIGSFFFAGLVWGMKLELDMDAKYNTLDRKIDTGIDATRASCSQSLSAVEANVAVVMADVAEIKTILQRGILPVTEERTHALEERVQRVESHVTGKAHGSP